jgi:hypothetical protein
VINETTANLVLVSIGSGLLAGQNIFSSIASVGDADHSLERVGEITAHDGGLDADCDKVGLVVIEHTKRTNMIIYRIPIAG